MVIADDQDPLGIEIFRKVFIAVDEFDHAMCDLQYSDDPVIGNILHASDIDFAVAGTESEFVFSHVTPLSVDLDQRKQDFCRF